MFGCAGGAHGRQRGAGGGGGDGGDGEWTGRYARAVSPRGRITLHGLALALGAALVWQMLVGGGAGGLPHDVWQQVLGRRADRAVTSALVGGSLGAAGVILQAMLRNPLASPDVLGPSAGASLGVLVSALVFGVAPGAWWSAGPATAGAVLTLGLLLLLAQRRGRIDPAGLILVGVTISVMAGALCAAAQQALAARGLLTPGPWAVVGSIRDGLPRWMIAAGAASSAACLAVALATARWADTAALPEDEARAAGVPIGLLRGGQVVSAGLLTGTAVVLAGPIGFVGLVGPHAARLALGPGYGRHALALSGRWLGPHAVHLIASTLAGGALVAAADAAVRAVQTPGGRLPVGVLTAIIGGPVLVALVRSQPRAA